MKLEGPDGSGLENDFNLLEASPEATAVLEALPENTALTFDGPATAEKKYTWNAVGILRGRDPRLQTDRGFALGASGSSGNRPAVNGDDIYNGADDDASGTTTVLELARVLGSGRKPRRTVIFALFGSEETGGPGINIFPAASSGAPEANRRQPRIRNAGTRRSRGEIGHGVADWMGALESRTHAVRLAAPNWSETLIPSRIFSRAPTIMFWQRRAWWPRPSRATDCTATTTSPATMWPTSTSGTWTQPSHRCWGRSAGW